jgi:hypothetical protein
MTFNQLTRLFENAEFDMPPKLFHATYRPLLRSFNQIKKRFKC